CVPGVPARLAHSRPLDTTPLCEPPEAVCSAPRRQRAQQGLWGEYFVFDFVEQHSGCFERVWRRRRLSQSVTQTIDESHRRVLELGQLRVRGERSLDAVIEAREPLRGLGFAPWIEQRVTCPGA